MTTPMMQQYQAIKDKVPDAILFFRLGDFYEMFGRDAEIAAPILEIALTGRDAGDGQRIPMCGVPYHAVDHYLPKLIQAGQRVAICEQMEDPRVAKGIVKREIIRIVSPGTLTENLPSEQCNNYLAAVYHNRDWGLAFMDVSTGEFTLFQSPFEETLFTELTRIRPAEVLLPPELGKRAKRWSGYYYTIRDRKTFQQIKPLLLRFPQRQELLNELSTAAQAAAALWAYLAEAMPGFDPAHILDISTYRQGQRMMLDPWTRRNLELTESIRGQNNKGTLLGVLDLTKTAGGGRLLRSWLEQPLLQEAEIRQRLDTVEDFSADSFLRSDLSKLLSGVYDLERLMAKVAYGSANARDLLALAQTLKRLPHMRSLLEASARPNLQRFLAPLSGLEALADMLENAINLEAPISLKEGRLIKTGYSTEVDELRTIASGGKEWLARLENSERERTGIRSLKVGYNKVFGYYLEVTNPNAHLVPADYQRKQTLANAERYITPTPKEFEQKILGAEAKLIEVEYQLFLEIREEVRKCIPSILVAARAVAELDVFLSLAEVAVRNHYVRPQLRQDGAILITEGRHPVVEQMLEHGAFVPNDTHLSPTQNIAVITGPNMAGKSTYMRQVALLVLMTHIGSFVPAQKASISLVDRIYTRIGASDDLAAGQSTFMVEMREVAHILENATPNSLLILDEIGRGTATFDGLSIAWAVVEHLAQDSKLKAKTLFATHYHELTQLADTLPGVFNLHVGVREHGEEIVFLHKILPGRADRSYGIQVARLAGLPTAVLGRAQALLAYLETSSPQAEALEPPSPAAQLSLFEPIPKHPAIEELMNLNVDDMTPREALNYLGDLRDRLWAGATL